MHFFTITSSGRRTSCQTIFYDCVIVVVAVIVTGIIITDYRPTQRVFSLSDFDYFDKVFRWPDKNWSFGSQHINFHPKKLTGKMQNTIWSPLTE